MKDSNELKNIALEFEKIYSDNQYKGQINSDLTYKLKKGKISILISAPHTVFHTREGREKLPELYTGSIGDIVQLMTNCYYICSVKDDNEDPHKVDITTYKKAVSEIISKYDIKYFIDLHGAKKTNPFDIDVGTDNGKLFPDEKIKEIINIFNENLIKKVKLNEKFKASSPVTLSNYVFNKLNVPSIQIEINYKYRNPNDEIENFSKIISSINDIVFYLNEMSKEED